MRTSTKVVTTTVIGLLGLCGLTQLVRASQTQTSVAVMHQLTATQLAEASDGDGEANDDNVNEQQESAKLRSLAKITPQQAQQVAEASLGGRASHVKLENEDGNLVYAVVIGQKEAKVDAGNGKVLYVDSLNSKRHEGTRPRSSIQVSQSAGDGDGETNDDG